MNTREQLEATCKAWAEELENPIVITEDNVDEYENEGLEIGDTVDGRIYLGSLETFNTEYRVGEDLSYRSAELLVAYGGPNISIDTQTSEVIGVWGNDRCAIAYIDNIELDEALEEQYDSMRGC